MKELTNYNTRFMKYELSNLEWEISPQRIKDVIRRVKGTENLDPRQESNRKTYKIDQPEPTKSQEVLQTVVDKFRNRFTTEFHRIKDSIASHNIKHPKNAFERYLSENYRGLILLAGNNEIQKPMVSLCNEPELDYKAEKSVISQIYHDFQTLLVVPLKKFIETGYKEVLIENHLFDSPLEIFLKAIRNHRVSLVEHSDLARETYRPIFSPVCHRMFTVEYNGYHVEALYHQGLEEKYREFKNYIDIYMKSYAGEIEKIQLLNNIKLSISEVCNLFLDEYPSERNNFKTIKYHRKDAFDRLSLKLHQFKIQNDTDVFFKSLSRLTEIQYIFITDSMEFIKSQIHIFKFCKKLTPNGNIPLKDDKKSVILDKIRWLAPINQLIAFLYDACTKVQSNGDPFMIASNKRIEKLLLENFVQKDGSPINPGTITAVLTPSKESKRPPIHKRIIFPDF